MNSPILKCKSHAEMMRVLNWLSECRIANTSRMGQLEIELGVSNVLGTPLSTYQSAPELLQLLTDVGQWLEVALQHGQINRGTANRDGDIVSQIRSAISK